MSTNLTVLHLAVELGKTSFGIGSAVLGLVVSQRALGLDVGVWSNNEPRELLELQRSLDGNGRVIRSFRALGPSRLGFSPALFRALLAHRCEFDVVHQHNLWTGHTLAANFWQRSTRRPTVVAPHGALESQALQRSSWKKCIALSLYQRENLQNASCLHALSKKEAMALRQFGLHNPIAVIPNGVPVAWLDSKGDPEAFRRRHGMHSDERIILYLGRITPIKGLPLLLHALGRLKDKLANWKLVIVGADEFGHKKEVQSLSAALGLDPYILWAGPLYGQRKRDAFASADLFVLPSLSEGAPMTVLEALGAGVPVLATQGSPWQELLTYNCGWWTDVSVEGIAGALEVALQSSGDTLQQMGGRGRDLVRRSYTWSSAAQKTQALYNWLVSGHDKPDFVLTERDAG